MENTELKKRPTFLTVLGILSFIGIGFAVIGGIWNMLTLESSKQLMTSLGNMSEELDASGALGGAMNEVMEGVKKLLDWGYVIYSIQIIAALICLVGVLQMWKLKKIGYYIYIVGEILPAIATFVLIGGFGPLGGMVAMLASLIFPILFIILYGLNLKHMS